MERLTERFENGQAAVLGCGNNCKYDYKYCNNYLEDCPTIGEIYEKLAAYEDAEEQGRILPAPLDDVERFSLDGGKTIWQRVYEADMPEGGTTVNENEAIEVLKDFDKQVTAKADGAYQSTVGKMACDTAIKALEEVQKYQQIGTPEECRAAREKQMPKRPIGLDMCTCPSCYTQNEIWKKRRNIAPNDIVYCWHCGQAVEILREDGE